MKALGLRPIIICLAIAGVLAVGPLRAEQAADGATADGGTAAGDSAPPATAEAEAAILQVRDAGVAGIGADTRFDPMAIRRHLPPGFAVTAGTYRTEDEDLPTINVLRDDAPILVVYSDGRDRVSLIQVLSPRIEVAGGRIGRPFATFFPDADRGGCRRGMEQLSGMAICTLPDSPRVNLLFDGTGWDGPDDAMPPPKVLRDWPLKYVIWSAEPLPMPQQ